MILSRSPFYINTVLSSSFVDSVKYTLDIQARSGSALETQDTYELTKAKPSEAFTNLFLDISNLIRDFYVFAPFSITDLQTGGVQKARESEVLSVDISTLESDSLGTPFTASNSTEECADGYGYFLEGQNTQPASKTLLSHRNYKMDARGYFLFPFRQVTESEVLTVDSTPVAIPANDTTLDKYNYLVINGSDYSGSVTIDYDGETTLIELIDECKYEVKEIQFVNRFGMVESIHFYKVKKDTVKVKSETFKNAYTNGVGYDTNRHQNKQYNKMSEMSFRMETGYLNEDYNQTIQELMESENVWLREGSVLSPVNVASESLELKTGIVDKLISYSIEFDYAFDLINNV